MNDFLVNAYIVSTAISFLTIFLLSPISFNIFVRYIGWGPTSIFAIGCLVWCLAFILIGIVFKPEEIKKG